MTGGDGVDLGWGGSGTLLGDDRGMETVPKLENSGKKPLSTTLVGDEVVPRVGMKGGWQKIPIEKPKQKLAKGV